MRVEDLVVVLRDSRRGGGLDGARGDIVVLGIELGKLFMVFDAIEGRAGRILLVFVVLGERL